uniref:Uncharacterized protein n=1 Tax=Myripristis murdjan TaxID=586833 RepID=A0A667YBI4_9TELE
MPPGAPNPTLVTFGKLVERDIELVVKSKNKVKNQNISILERKALSELQNNPKILIKPADKGGAVVVQNTKDYLTEAYRQLGDSSFYRQLPHNPVETFVEERDSILNRALEKQWITKKQFEFLKVEYPMTPVFYLLPKIHKRLVNPPDRPIVASKNSLNNNLDYAIARHYKEKNHGSAASLRFIGIERLLPIPRGGNIIKQLLRREAFWINELFTVEPFGMNDSHDLTCFL